jgi:hypothetical protein
MADPIHQRKAIRDAVVTALVAAATSAGSRVFPTRVVPWRKTELPAVSVYALDEKSDDQQTAPRWLKRTMTLSVEAVVRQGANVDDALDALALELEAAMHADPTFGDVCGDSTLTGTELEVLEQGDQLFGLLRLTYSVTYDTDAPYARDVATDDLETIEAQTSIGGAQAAADRAEDHIDLEAP